MLMPQKNRKAIYEYLFKEGVCVAKKDFNQKTHPDIQGVTNLEVIKACKVCPPIEIAKAFILFKKVLILNMKTISFE